MKRYSTSEIKPGYKIIIDGSPCVVIANEFVQPGKGRAFNRIKCKNILKKKIIDKTYTSGDTIEVAQIEDKEMTFLYNDFATFYFMDTSNYEQLAIDSTICEKIKDWLVEQENYAVVLWNGEVLEVSPPNFVILEIAHTTEGVKGDTKSGNVLKEATTTNGAIIKVPLFVKEGDKVKMDTRDGNYVSKA